MFFKYNLPTIKSIQKKKKKNQTSTSTIIFECQKLLLEGNFQHQKS